MSLRPSAFVGVTSSRRASAVPKLAPQRSRPDLKLVPGERELRFGAHAPRWRLVAYVGLTCVMLLALVMFHVLLSQGQFGLDKMQAKTSAEQATYERLRLQVAQLESPERITREATERLGMVPAGQVTAVSPRSEDVAPGTGAVVDKKATDSDGTTDPANAHTWSELKPHLSASSQ